MNNVLLIIIIMVLASIIIFMIGTIKKLRRENITDPLTGLYNFSYFQKRLKEEINRAKRHGDKQSLQVLFIDLNRFKAVNDTLGHTVGDKVLKEVANILKANLRSYDVAARRSGDEFLVTLTEENKELAHRVAEKIVQKIREIPLNNNSKLVIGASIGISFLDPKYPERDLLDIADKKMYEDKKQNTITRIKNRIVYV
jgi:diguanylate cyclase (GGDEF)-like protein